VNPDAVIIGAGAVGCAVAAHLLRLDPTLSVLLVDRQHVGAGSTSRSTAAFRHQWSVPVHVAFSRYSSLEYERLSAAGHPIQFRRNGYLFLFAEDSALAAATARVERQRALGVRGVDVFSPGDLAGRVPCGPHLAVGRLAGATWGPEDGFLDPLSVAQAYLDEARRAGLAYRPGRAAIELLTDAAGKRACGIRLQDGATVHAFRVVNCAGIWSHAVAASAGLTLPVRPAKRYLYHSHPLRELDVSRWPMTIGPRGAHIRPAEGNTLMMAWEHRPRPMSACPDPETLWETQDVIDPGFGIGPSDYGIEVLTELATVIPVLAEAVGLSRASCGWYTVTRDHKAILGPDSRLEGLFHATGFSGHGIMHAAATGLCVAEIVLGREPTLGSRSELDEHFGLQPLLEGRTREPVEDMVL
jgi:sarcosine oxidase subunit beta